MNAATELSRCRRRSSRSTVPAALLRTVTTSRPASAAEAGVVPWAESGLSTRVRRTSPWAMGSGRGLGGDPAHAGDLDQHPLQVPHELERPLDVAGVLVGVDVGEAGQPGDLLVHHRVVFHGAAAERVDALVEVVVASG